MVNIIAKRIVFEEFLQSDACPSKIIPALKQILIRGNRRDDVIRSMGQVIEQLGKSGNPSRTAANEIVKEL